MVLSMMLNSLLFVFRVRAVYLNSTKITVVFGLLWLTTLTQLLPSISTQLHITNKTPNDCDSLLETKPWVVIGFIFTAIFDTAVFVAVSVQVLGFTGGKLTWKERLSSFLHGKELGKVTRAVLQTGQLFYLYVNTTILYDNILSRLTVLQGHCHSWLFCYRRAHWVLSSSTSERGVRPHWCRSSEHHGLQSFPISQVAFISNLDPVPSHQAGYRDDSFYTRRDLHKSNQYDNRGNFIEVNIRSGVLKVSRWVSDAITRTVLEVLWSHWHAQ